MTSEAWDLAHAAAETAGVTLRPLTSIADADAILRVMIATWGEHQLLPREEIVALAESGNVPWGADAGGQTIGYVLGWAGVDPEDGLHLHSHMLAAVPDRRHRGVGYALKLAQRAACLEQGIHLIRWTFDPMISRNAWLNLGKLGALADRFRRDLYGEMADELNVGERSDRLVVRWELDRDPYLLETSVPGIFACGDVRFSPVKRVAAAVGEGSMAIAFVHQYLRDAELRSALT
jgi:predicted GNAT superfamily acetyltransferase